MNEIAIGGGGLLLLGMLVYFFIVLPALDEDEWDSIERELDEVEQWKK